MVVPELHQSVWMGSDRRIGMHSRVWFASFMIGNLTHVSGLTLWVIDSQSQSGTSSKKSTKSLSKCCSKSSALRVNGYVVGLFMVPENIGASVISWSMICPTWKVNGLFVALRPTVSSCRTPERRVNVRLTIRSLGSSRLVCETRLSEIPERN